jgi:hypothetical protein
MYEWFDVCGVHTAEYVSIFTDDDLQTFRTAPLVVRTYYGSGGLWETDAFTLGNLLQAEQNN